MKDVVIDVLFVLGFALFVMALFLSGLNDLTIHGYQIVNGCLFGCSFCWFGIALIN